MNKFILFLLLLCGFTSCKDSAEAHFKKDIIGRWSVVKSELNNKPSKSMENAFFEFGENERVLSNVLEEKEVEYKIDGSKVMMASSEPLQLDITYMQGDSMVMEGNYSLYYLKLFMSKEQ